MPLDSEAVYPDCPTVVRTVSVGGVSKLELLDALQRHAIEMNESAERLFASELFTTSETQYVVTTVELSVHNLGFPQGATTAELHAKAQALGLQLCPLELGPHLRLQYLDQPEGYWGMPERQHQAPSGSITVASASLSDDGGFPKGFYLRRIKGVLWLRGYRAGDDHVWEHDDRLLFCR